MSERIEALAERVTACLGSRVERVAGIASELTLELAPERLLEVATALRDDPELKFSCFIDVCGVDYLHYGQDEWKTAAATATGFSRGVRAHPSGAPGRKHRFAAIYHLLSLDWNARLRLRVYCEDGEPPVLDSVTPVWAGANWFEREAFDLFGILFRGHPDLRRLLTDYGFVGHPFRKDFPLSGHVEVRYDPDKGRVVYEPVSIVPRTLVPKVIRHDNRYDPALVDRPAGVTTGVGPVIPPGAARG
jgi:NADH-quinone oxidoreductase subunit C